MSLFEIGGIAGSLVVGAASDLVVKAAQRNGIWLEAHHRQLIQLPRREHFWCGSASGVSDVCLYNRLWYDHAILGDVDRCYSLLNSSSL